MGVLRGGSTFACIADAIPLTSCEPAFASGATAGRHTFSVAATDAADNTDPTRRRARSDQPHRCAADPRGLPARRQGGRRDERLGRRIGTGGTDLMFGLAGNDLLRGLIGPDCIAGGAGRDRLLGDAGFDVIAGGSGSDSLSGAAGNDEAPATIASRAARASTSSPATRAPIG